MKFDSDTIIKHRFWFILGVAVLFNLIAWTTMLITVPAKVSNEEQKITKTWKSDAKYNNFKSEEAVRRKREEADLTIKQQGNSWEGLYQKQDDTLKRTATWPPELEKKINKGKIALEVVIFDKAKPGELEKSSTKLAGILTFSDKEELTIKLPGGNNTATFLHNDDTKILLDSIKDKRQLPNVLNQNLGKPVQVTFQEGRFFGDKFSRAEYDLYAQTYAKQLLPVFMELGPVNELGEPVIQFRSGNSSTAGGDSGGFGGIRTGGGMPGTPGTIKSKMGGGPKVGVGSAPKFPPGGGSGTAEGEEDYNRGEVWVFDPTKKNLPPPDSRFFSYVKGMPGKTDPKDPAYWKFSEMKEDEIAEEIWIAQENLWIQRELFKCLKKANDEAARFTPEGGKTNEADGKTAHKKWKNFYWEIEFTVVGGNALQVKLTNLRPYRQEISDLHFLVKVKPDTKDKSGKETRAKYIVFPPKDGPQFTGKPVDAGKSHTNEPIPLPGGATADGVYDVKQVLTYKTAAVKRIELIVIGTDKDMVLSHRLVYKDLLPYKKKIEKKDDVAADDPNKGDPGKQPGGKLKGPLGFGKEAGGAQDSNVTQHGQSRERYLEVTGQARKVPVLLVLIVDPEQKALVEAAFLDSPLRFLITQVMWQRHQGTMVPPEIGEPKKTGSPGSGDKTGPPGTVGGSEATPPPANEEMENLEIAIYGVVTFYERPGRPQAPEEKK